MTTLTIQWQRVINESGQTCERCKNTDDAVEIAFRKLQKALIELGIEEKLETIKIDYSAFKNDPLQSNQIWIGDKPLEEWIGGTVGQVE